MADTKSKMISGVSFEISQPYLAGAVLNEAEAKTLNQVRSENIGNNVREAVKKLLEAGDTAGATALVSKKDASYVFTLATVGATKTLDPVEREARALAKDIIKTHLAATGRKISVVPEGETKESWEEKIEANIEKIATSDNVLKAAKQAVDQKKKRLETLTSSVDLGGTDTSAPASA